MLLPRMLIIFCSCAIVLVGNDTRMGSPPRKNGLTSCRSGVIISMRQLSFASSGTVTRSWSSTNLIASSARSRIICGFRSERADKLSLGRHHFHAPALFRQLGNSHEVVVFDKLDRFEREVANHLRL